MWFCSTSVPCFDFFSCAHRWNGSSHYLKIIWNPCSVFLLLFLRNKTVRFCFETLKIHLFFFLFKLWWLKTLTVVSSRNVFQDDQTLQTLHWLSLIIIPQTGWHSLKGIFIPTPKLSPAYRSVNCQFSAMPYQLCFLSPDLQSTISNRAK